MSTSRHDPTTDVPVSTGRPPRARDAVERISPHLIRKLADGAGSDPDVIRLWFGEGREPTPRFIREACERALREGRTFYTPNFGIDELRAEISAYHGRLGRRPVEADRTVVTSAGVSALALVAQCLVDPGDRVVVVSPVWPNAYESVRVLGGSLTHVPLRMRDGAWRLDVDELLAAVDSDTRMLLVNSPSNPTGWTMTGAQQAAVLDHCRRTGTWLVADEVYERLYYGPTRPGLPVAAPSFLDLGTEDDRLIVVNSFSKAWAMTGWRLGWMVVPRGLTPALAKLIEFNMSCATTFVQYGGIAAVRHGEPFIAEQLAGLRARRDTVVPRIAALPGVRTAMPDGAFYALFDVAGASDSFALAERILGATGVGLAPGAAFGPAGEGYLRMCLAAPEDELLGAIDRLAAFFGR